MNRAEFALQITASAAAHISLEVLKANSRDEIVAGGVDVACTIEPNRRIDSAERFAQGAQAARAQCAALHAMPRLAACRTTRQHGDDVHG